MKQIFHIGLLCLAAYFHCLSLSAQVGRYDNLPQEDRDEFFKSARHYIQNSYYYGIAEAISNADVHEGLIEFLMAGKKSRYQPELLLEPGQQRYLTPAQYLERIRQDFSEIDSDELEFIADNFSFDNRVVENPENTLNCFIQVEYDLTVKRIETILLKRRCRMCCLFPDPLIKRNVKTMQIEPLEDIYIASEIFPVSETQLQASDETRFQEAQEWYDQGLAEKYLPVFQELANKGYAAAQYYLGNCYSNGEGVTQDYTEAVKWYRKAAEQGYATAQLILGVSYKGGIGVSKNGEKAVEWYTKAAEQGDALAQIFLGNMYYSGEGVTQDYTEAVKWYRKAAEQGATLAQNNLGNCYYNGQGVTQDYTEAVKWYRKAAERENTDAQCNLGYCYYFGKGVPQNETKAVEWYRKAAEQGNAIAQCNLGYCYYFGKGVPQNETKAVEWYRKSAEQGHVTAQCNLGYCYENGIGISKDGEKAVEWYTKAANQGDADAQKAIERLKFNFQRYLNNPGGIK